MANSKTDGTSPNAMDRVTNLPLINSVLKKTDSTYSYIKDSHRLVKWGLSYAETTVNVTVSATTPLVKWFKGDISTKVDQKLCEGLDILEDKIPIITKSPQEIYDATKTVMSSSPLATIKKFYSIQQQVSTLKENIVKANEYSKWQYY